MVEWGGGVVYYVGLEVVSFYKVRYHHQGYDQSSRRELECVYQM